MIDYEKKTDAQNEQDQLDHIGIRNKWSNFNQTFGHKVFSFKVNVTKAIDYITDINKKKPKKEIYYEHLNRNCTVLPDRNHPYCPECGGRIVYKVKT